MMELDNVTVKPPSIIFERLWQSGGGSEDWNKANTTPNFKKGHKVHEGEPQAHQPPLDLWEEDGTYNPANHFQTHEGHEGLARICERKIMPHDLKAFFHKITS